MSRLRNDVITGVILLGFALALHLVIIPSQVASAGEGPIALSPSLFCHITAFLLLMLSISLIIAGLMDKKPRAHRDMAQLTYTAGRGTAAVFLSVLYILAIEILGYFSSTVLFMGIFLFFSGVRSWKGGVLFLAATIPFIYLLFVKALKVILPSGLII